MIKAIHFTKKPQYKELSTIKECKKYLDSNTTTWLHFQGESKEKIKDLAEKLGYHDLLIEDILSKTERPKAEVFDDHLLVTFASLYYENKRITRMRGSIIWTKSNVISFHSAKHPHLEDVREHLQKFKPGPDYVVYRILDYTVDEYFKVLEQLGDDIEKLEDSIMRNPTDHDLKTLHKLKTATIHIRKAVWPLREIINALSRGDFRDFQKSTKTHLRDLHDHTIEVIDTQETFRDMLSSMLDLYISTVSKKMNEVMQVLTVIATIFIPLTFVAGVYGMNFEYMPELEWKYGYAFAWGIMLLVALAMGVFFRKKRWL